MKKLLRNFMMLFLVMLGLASCSDNNDNSAADNTTEYGEGTAEFNPAILLQGKVYLGEGLDEDLKQAFEWGVSDVVSVPDADADFVLVNKLTDVSEEVLRQVYSNGGVIAVMYPDAAELEAYRDSHDWLDVNTYNVDNSLMMFAFTNDNTCHYIKKPIVDEECDPLWLQLEAAENYYVYIANMLTDVMEDITDYDTAPTRRAAAADEKKAKMEEFAGHKPEKVHQPFTVCHTFRQLLLSDPDRLQGSFTLTTEYDIFTVHVYEGEVGAGDYYGMKMTATVSSESMWKGKGWNKHGGTYVRWCGAYTTDFYVDSHLTTKKSTADADWFEDTNDRIMFTANGSPSPETTVGKTTYEDKNGFSLSASHSIGGKLGASEKNGAEGGVNIDLLSVKYGWDWSHSEKRDISDVDILNERKRGNWAGWHMVFNNLPEFQWSQQYGFNEKNNQAARSSMSIHGVWLWHDMSGKDNEDRQPYALCTWMKAKFDIQSFITTGADLQTSSIERDFRDSRWMPKVVNVTCGNIKLVNNLPDDLTIYDVEVSRADNGKIVSLYEPTIDNGKEQMLGSYNSNKQYMVTFKAKKGNGEPRIYKYNLHPTVKLVHKTTTTLYARSDFAPQ